MPRDDAISIGYPRQFFLLAAVTTVLLLTHRRLPALGAVPSVGVYGGLHSSVLVASLRPRQSAWRKACFVAAAVGLAMLCVAMARFSGQLFEASLGAGAPALLLTLSSGLGAVSYGLLIRRSWLKDLSRRGLAFITLCCVTSTLLALPLGTYLHTIGGWWFATIWWWTFSVALWRHRRRYRIEVRDVWHS